MNVDFIFNVSTEHHLNMYCTEMWEKVFCFIICFKKVLELYANLGENNKILTLEILAKVSMET